MQGKVVPANSIIRIQIFINVFGLYDFKYHEVTGFGFYAAKQHQTVKFCRFMLF